MAFFSSWQFAPSSCACAKIPRQRVRMLSRCVAPVYSETIALVYWCSTRVGYFAPSPCSYVMPAAPNCVVGTVSP